MSFLFNNLGRGFLYTIGKFLAIGAIILLIGLAFAYWPKADVNNYDYFGGVFNEK